MDEEEEDVAVPVVSSGGVCIATISGDSLPSLGDGCVCAAAAVDAAAAEGGAVIAGLMVEKDVSARGIVAIHTCILCTVTLRLSSIDATSEAVSADIYD